MNWERKIHVSIDPGVEIGAAFWSAVKGWNKLTLPRLCCVFTGHGSWQEKCDQVLDKLELAIVENEFEIVSATIEYPSFMQGHGGMRTARSGDLVKLSYQCGRIHELFYRGLGVKACTVQVARWKGQLPKEQVNRRVLRMYTKAFGKKALQELHAVGASRAQSHDWDAIGIGLWAKGYF